MKNNNDFEFKYSAPTVEERREIESIRNSYIKQEKTKLEKLRSLDNKVKNIPTITALIIGIIGILVFGLGLTMVLYWNLLVYGCIVAIIGVIPMSLAYYAYVKVYNKLKAKYSKEILQLSEELLNDEEK